MNFSSEDYIFLTEHGIDCSDQVRKSHLGIKVVVGMSGGVDSSVAALVCLAQGYDVTGIFMKNWEDDSKDCPAVADYQDVVAVSERLEIPYYAVNFAKEYFDEVFDDFVKEYELGWTPNPDILCNSKIKFNVFFKYAQSLGAHKLATGHYAQISSDNCYLQKGVDNNKDQSYFLYRVPEKVWESVLFPLGHIEKSYVRAIAERFDLATSTKKDSTGICFIGEKKFRDFLGQYMKSQKGFFKTLDGEVVGEHQGQCYYTLGQRRGLGLGGPGRRWYVQGKDTKSNDVFVVRGDDHPSLYVDELIAGDIVGRQLQDQSLDIKINCKIRYRQADQSCRIQKSGDKIKVIFDRPQKGVACGQSVVFYHGDICLGGGVIEEVGATYYDRGIDLPSQT